MLRSAITCAILTPAGDSKYRIMGVLHKDERSKQVDPQFDVLDKMFRGVIIKENELKAFGETLEDH